MSDTPKNKKEKGFFTKISSWVKENIQQITSKQQQALAPSCSQFAKTLEAVSKRFSANDSQQPHSSITIQTLRFSSLPKQEPATTAVEVNSPQVKPTIH